MYAIKDGNGNVLWQYGQYDRIGLAHGALVDAMEQHPNDGCHIDEIEDYDTLADALFGIKSAYDEFIPKAEGFISRNR